MSPARRIGIDQAAFMLHVTPRDIRIQLQIGLLGGYIKEGQWWVNREHLLELVKHTHSNQPRKSVTITLTEEGLYRLEQLCKNTALSKSDVIDRLLRQSTVPFHQPPEKHDDD